MDGRRDTGSASSRSALAALTRVDPLAPVTGLLGLVIFASHGFNGGLTRDLGFYAYAGQRFADGVAPYEGIFNQTGPLAHMLPALGVWAARFVGGDELLGMRITFCLLAAACVSVAYLVGRDVFGSRAAGLVGAAALAAMSGFVDLASRGPREKTALVLFLLLAMWAAHHRRWLAGGVFVGLATLTLQVGLIVGAPVAIVVALVGSAPGERLGSLVRFVCGGAITLTAMAAYFVTVGAFGDFVYGYVTVNLRYPTGHRDLDLVRIADSLLDGFGVSTVFIVVGLAGALLLPVIERSHVHDDRDRYAMLAGLGAGTIAGLVWVGIDFDQWPDAFYLLPLAVVGCAAVFAWLANMLPARIAAMAGLGLVAFAVVLGFQFALSSRANVLDSQRASVDRVKDVLGSDFSMISIEAPQALVLAKKVSPTKHQLVGGQLGHSLDANWPGGMRAFRRWVVDQHATLVAVGNTRLNWTAVLDRHYQLIGCAPTWQWWAVRSLEPDVMQQLTATNADTCRRSAADRLADDGGGPPLSRGSNLLEATGWSA